MKDRVKKELEFLQNSLDYLHELYFTCDNEFSELERELLYQQREVSYRLKHILKMRVSLYDDYKPKDEKNIEVPLL